MHLPPLAPKKKKKKICLRFYGEKSQSALSFFDEFLRVGCPCQFPMGFGRFGTSSWYNQVGLVHLPRKRLKLAQSISYKCYRIRGYFPRNYTVEKFRS